MTGRKFESLRSKHAEVLSNLDAVKGATQAILNDTENDLLRAFRARLYEVQIELDREKSKKVSSCFLKMT